VTVTADPATNTKTRTAPPISPPARRLPWRSPADQPVWARPALVTLAGLAGSIYAAGIRDGLVHGYYAPAVKSMSDHARRSQMQRPVYGTDFQRVRRPRMTAIVSRHLPADSRVAPRPARGFSRNAASPYVHA